jgi:hypothetical protein
MILPLLLLKFLLKVANLLDIAQSQSLEKIPANQDHI